VLQAWRAARPTFSQSRFAAAGHPIAFLKAYKDAGLDEQHVQVLATGDLTDENQFDQLGDAALGMITVFDYAEAHASPFNRNFVKAFYAAASPGLRPEFVAVAAYDVMNAIYKLVEAQNGKIDPDKTMALLKGMHFESPRGLIAIDQNRDIVQNIYIRKVQKVDGKLQNVEFDTNPNVNGLGQQIKLRAGRNRAWPILSISWAPASRMASCCS